MITIFLDDMVVAEHKLIREKQRNPIVKPEHMPKSHQAMLDYNEEGFLTFAEKVGPQATTAFRYYLERGDAPEQGYQFCASFKHLAERYGFPLFEMACETVSSSGNELTLPNIEDCLKRMEESRDPALSIAHDTKGLTRGEDQFNF